MWCMAAAGLLAALVATVAREPSDNCMNTKSRDAPCDAEKGDAKEETAADEEDAAEGRREKTPALLLRAVRGEASSVCSKLLCMLLLLLLLMSLSSSPSSRSSLSSQV
jgi:hypothetical protein